MKAILFAILAFFAINAQAENFLIHAKQDGSIQRYMTYEAQNMKRTADNNWMYVIYRGCKQLTAEQIVKREKLVPNKNIVGGYYCAAPNDSTYIFIRDIHQIKDDHVLVTK